MPLYLEDVLTDEDLLTNPKLIYKLGRSAGIDYSVMITSALQLIPTVDKFSFQTGQEFWLYIGYSYPRRLRYLVTKIDEHSSLPQTLRLRKDGNPWTPNSRPRYRVFYDQWRVQLIN